MSLFGNRLEKYTSFYYNFPTMKRKNIVWFFVLLIGVVLIISAVLGFGWADLTRDSNIPISARPIAPLTDFASCELTGKLVFNSPTNYTNDNAYLKYKNVDSDSRVVLWEITPGEIGSDVRVGPNMLLQHEVPNDEVKISIFFKNPPQNKSYDLKASVTYGVLVVDDNGTETIETLAAECGGSTEVVIDY